MTGAVVSMCLLGLALILISFFVADSSAGQSESFNLDLLTVNEDYEFSEREQSIIRRKIEDVIAKQAKEILLETGDSLANMANEKMLALGDYAVAVCDEIEKNHKEVMFLYSMLDDKQKEIMHTVRQVDETVQIAGQLQDMLEERMMAEADHLASSHQDFGARQGLRDVSGRGEEYREGVGGLREASGIFDRTQGQAGNVDRMQKPAGWQGEKQEQTGGSGRKQEQAGGSGRKQKASGRKRKTSGGSGRKQETASGQEQKWNLSVPDRFEEGENDSAEWNRTQAMHMEELTMEQEIRQTGKEPGWNPTPEWTGTEAPDRENANEEILELYQEGVSVIEIAKRLGLGVGEVKLVIDLYQGE